MFDYFIPESLVTEIIAAHFEQRTKPCLRSVIEHRAFTNNDFPNCENPFLYPSSKIKLLIDNAIAEFFSREYCDVHCWYFTPKLIRNILNSLIIMNYMPINTRFKSYYLPHYEEIAVVMC